MGTRAQELCAQLERLEASAGDSTPAVGGALGRRRVSRAQWPLQPGLPSPFSCLPGVPLSRWRTWDSGQALIGHRRAPSEKWHRVLDREDTGPFSSSCNPSGSGGGGAVPISVPGSMPGPASCLPWECFGPRGSWLAGGCLAGVGDRGPEAGPRDRQQATEPDVGKDGPVETLPAVSRVQGRAMTAVDRGAWVQWDHRFGPGRPALVSLPCLLPRAGHLAQPAEREEQTPLGQAGRAGWAVGSWALGLPSRGRVGPGLSQAPCPSVPRRTKTTQASPRCTWPPASGTLCWCSGCFGRATRPPWRPWRGPCPCITPPSAAT